jgi:hypothetical protein
MISPHASTCRWATPTLFLPGAQWIEAWDFAWSCLRDEPPLVLHDPQKCATCPRWEPRSAEKTMPAPTAIAHNCC